jgi:hypothetical protein
MNGERFPYSLFPDVLTTTTKKLCLLRSRGRKHKLFLSLFLAVIHTS